MLAGQIENLFSIPVFNFKLNFNENKYFQYTFIII